MTSSPSAALPCASKLRWPVHQRCASRKAKSVWVMLPTSVRAPPKGKYLCWLSKLPLLSVTATTEPSWSVNRYFSPLPSFSHKRLRFGCLAGTFKPSRRHKRSTHLWFHSPAFGVQYGCNATITISSVLTRQFHHTQSQAVFIVYCSLDIALRGSRLSEGPADFSL